MKIQFIYFCCSAAEISFSKPGGAAIIISHYFFLSPAGSINEDRGDGDRGTKA